MKTPDDFTEKAFGHKRDGLQCVTCGSKKIQPEDFRNDISHKEYKISKMCQKCQDEIFGID